MKYPSQEDVLNAEFDQTVNCAVQGKWGITPDNNIKNIINDFNNHVKKITLKVSKFRRFWDFSMTLNLKGTFPLKILLDYLIVLLILKLP